MGKSRQVFDPDSGAVESAPSGSIRRGSGSGDDELRPTTGTRTHPGDGQVGEDGADSGKKCKSCGESREDELRLVGFRNVYMTPGGPMMEQEMEVVCEDCHSHMDLAWQFMTYESEVHH